MLLTVFLKLLFIKYGLKFKDKMHLTQGHIVAPYICVTSVGPPSPVPSSTLLDNIAHSVSSRAKCEGGCSLPPHSLSHAGTVLIKYSSFIGLFWHVRKGKATVVIIE